MRDQHLVLTATLITLSVLALGLGFGPSCSTITASAKEGCEAGLTECNGQCVDTDANRDNCGSCGTVCGGGEVCDGSGTCSLSCQDGLTNCDGECANLLTDNRFCSADGTCGDGCIAGDACNGAGACTVACPEGLRVCDGECVNLDTDNRYCSTNGACGPGCDSGEVCDGSGVCALSCQDGLTVCDSECVNLRTDDRFCSATGICGPGCGAGEACNNGVCELDCQPGLSRCADASGAQECVNTLLDPRFCSTDGTCGIDCGDGYACAAGTCEPICSPGETTCDGNPPVCSALEDFDNCGACGNTCALDRDCAGTAQLSCLACTPGTSTLVAPPGDIPTGLKVTCLSAPCPIIECGQITYWVYSFVDNRTSLSLTGYAPNGDIVRGPIEKPGARYIDTISVNAATETARLVGQDGSTVVVPWSEFLLP